MKNDEMFELEINLFSFATIKNSIILIIYYYHFIHMF